MKMCETCMQRYFCDGQFEFECITGSGRHYSSDNRPSLSLKEPPKPKKEITQIKTISAKSDEDFDNTVNKWLEENSDNIALVDIKYIYNNSWNCAMIVYKTRVWGEKQ